MHTAHLGAGTWLVLKAREFIFTYRTTHSASYQSQDVEPVTLYRSHSPAPLLCKEGVEVPRWWGQGLSKLEWSAQVS